MENVRHRDPRNEKTARRRLMEKQQLAVLIAAFLTPIVGWLWITTFGAIERVIRRMPDGLSKKILLLGRESEADGQLLNGGPDERVSLRQLKSAASYTRRKSAG